MTKTSRTLQTISFILVGALLALFIGLMIVSIQESREVIKKLDSIDARITNLEQDQQSIKEALDAHGFEDLNL